MSRFASRWLVAAMAGLLGACAAPQISTREIRRSEPAAVSLLQESQRAHGRTAFAKVRDVSVKYDGRWAAIGPRFQPVLADTKFRRSSEERLIIRTRTMAQEHTGPAGKKVVVRSPGKVSVAYNRAPSDLEITHKSAEEKCVPQEIFRAFLKSVC
jgi:hypothetical protein